MRTILVFALLVAGICASIAPRSFDIRDKIARQNSRLSPVEEMVIEAIEDLSQDIREAGLDPFFIQREASEYALPVPVLFNYAVALEELHFFGLSDIVINRMSFSLLNFRLDFELELPYLDASLRFAGGHVTLFDNTLSCEASGRLNVQNTVVRGAANVHVGIGAGILISGVDVDFNLGRINSNLKLAIQDTDVSDNINNFMTSTIPNTLLEFIDEVNELIAIILLDYLNENILN